MLFALAMAASAGLSAYGKIKEGQNAKKNAQSKAELEMMNAGLMWDSVDALERNATLSRQDAALNAKLMEAQAKQEQQRSRTERGIGQYNAERVRQEGEKVLERQTLLLAASGGGMGGSGAAIRESTAVEADLQRRLELAAGNERARSIADGAANLRFGAKQTRLQGKIGYANALNEIEGMKTRAQMAEMGAASTVESGKNAAQAGWISGGATLLNAAGSYGGKMSSSLGSTPSKAYDPKWSDTRTIRYM
jgi:hypothetical protein